MCIHTLGTALKNWLTLILVSCLGVIALGVWARLVSKLFCIGYGC